MLDLLNITRRYRVSAGLLSTRILTAVDKLSLSLRKGEFFSLVGESGCGKSTLARIVCGLEAQSEGEMRIDGKTITGTAEFADKGLRRRVQMIFQDPYSSLNPRMRIRDILAEPLISLGWGNAQAVQTRVAELASIIRFPDSALERFPHQFSGGQRQRVAIARAIAANPDLLICDEPVSALDVSIKGQIINLLLDIQEQLGTTILFISHDLSLVRKISDRVGVMYLGSLVEVAPAQQLFADPRHPYTRLLIESVPALNGKRREEQVLAAGEMPSPFAIPSGCRFRDRCPLAFDRCATEAPGLQPVTSDERHLAACHLRAQPAPRPAERPPVTIPQIDLFRTAAETTTP
ncbi:MAG TPA: oligopeptide/dipeptide ABC transporter ATP-binding protein [Rhizobiaceae bacterium]|nr:oligopeptide/dipeptide ABC transporter ATP-binding protein [Rhizobiaceae bacterium]